MIMCMIIYDCVMTQRHEDFLEVSLLSEASSKRDTEGRPSVSLGRWVVV